ncbi:MAG: hypothetical protein ACRDEA_11320 [Microcystaceae cyanobacterium]
MAVLPPHNLLIQDAATLALHREHLISSKYPWRSYFNDNDNQADGSWLSRSPFHFTNDI